MDLSLKILPVTVLLMVTQRICESQSWRAVGILVALICVFGLPGYARADNPPDTAAPGDSPLQRCGALLPGFDDNPTDVKHEIREAGVNEPVAVRLTWTRSDATGPDKEGWIICFFLPRSETNGLWQIDLVDSQKFGKLKRYDVQQLNKLLYLRNHSNISPEGHPAPTIWTPWLYYLQQTINGVTLGCLYALLAVAFTLIYGITRFINLAFGDLYMVGAFTTYVGYLLTVVSGASFTFLPIIAIGCFVVASAAAAGWTVNRMVFSKMQSAATTVPLVASIAVAIVLREAVRLLQGPKTRWMPQNPYTAWKIIEGLGYDVYLRKWHLFIGLATGAISALLWLASRRTTFGRSYRACAQDPRMAALVGVDVRGTISRSFVLSGALTGAAGLFEALQYNAVDFNMGFIVGLKSLIAALLGGIGSLPGAMLGGFLLALIETYSGMLIGFEWRDVVTFAVLALVLIFKPGGLLGTLRLMPADERP
jgi:branched-chain amino acid transport system permease protein